MGGAVGYGTVFKVDATGAETVLHNFTDGTHGFEPVGGLLKIPRATFTALLITVVHPTTGSSSG